MKYTKIAVHTPDLDTYYKVLDTISNPKNLQEHQFDTYKDNTCICLKNTQNTYDEGRYCRKKWYLENNYEVISFEKFERDLLNKTIQYEIY